jgi:FkbM family methyltransferase
MLIPFSEVCNILTQQGIRVHGILHIGAHECEERAAYNENGVVDDKIFWLEGNPEKVSMNREKGVPHIYEGLIFDCEKEVDFHITKNNHIEGNTESSSILPLAIHQNFYPYITVNEVKKMKTTTIDTWVRKNDIPIQKLNFWNLDIQGVELQALKGAGDMIEFADAIYVEVNQIQLYEGCALLPELNHFLESKGFNRKALKMAEQGWGDALFIRRV